MDFLPLCVVLFYIPNLRWNGWQTGPQDSKLITFGAFDGPWMWFFFIVIMDVHVHEICINWRKLFITSHFCVCFFMLSFCNTRWVLLWRSKFSNDKWSFRRISSHRNYLANHRNHGKLNLGYSSLWCFSSKYFWYRIHNNGNYFWFAHHFWTFSWFNSILLQHIQDPLQANINLTSTPKYFDHSFLNWWILPIFDNLVQL